MYEHLCVAVATETETETEVATVSGIECGDPFLAALGSWASHLL
jgi:hypothetical protein